MYHIKLLAFFTTSPRACENSTTLQRLLCCSHGKSYYYYYNLLQMPTWKKLYTLLGCKNGSGTTNMWCVSRGMFTLNSLLDSKSTYLINSILIWYKKQYISTYNKNRESENDVISAPKRNSTRRELPNVPTEFNSHYHRLEVQSPNTLLTRRKNEAKAKNHGFELELSFGVTLLHLRQE